MQRGLVDKGIWQIINLVPHCVEKEIENVRASIFSEEIECCGRDGGNTDLIGVEIISKSELVTKESGRFVAYNNTCM
jgi:hypothetical protein